MRAIVAFAHALADPTRWRIIQLVLDEAMCVCELADILGMPQSSVSSHLQVVRKAGLLASERCEKWVYYRVDPRFHGLLVELGTTFAASASVDRVLRLDARKAQRRLTQREQSCCPRPKALARLSPYDASDCEPLSTTKTP
jgi:ArsR family transcriptional regulator, arsenate/arsenite/antimonite-responsive transcriptional repressor